MSSHSRFSLLEYSQWCGKVFERSGRAAGRAAAMSSAVHARYAEQSDADQKLALLTKDEIEEIGTWFAPTEVRVMGELLLYEQAEKEVHIGLDADCMFVPWDSPKCITHGHPDMFWVREVGDKRVVFIGDMKKSFRTVESPANLQNIAAGFSLCSMANAETFIPMIWVLEDGEWMIGDPVDVAGFGALELAERLVHAATNFGEAVKGAHCSRCWARWDCPDHLLPAHEAGSWLIPVTEGNKITKDNALWLLTSLKAYQDAAFVVETALKDYAAENPIVDPTTGKVWGPSIRRGRESCRVKRLREMLGDEAEQYITRGKDYQVFEWRKQ